MFDAEQKLIISNQPLCRNIRVAAGAYDPGTPLRAILEQRIASGVTPRRTSKITSRARSSRPWPRANRWYIINELRDGHVIAISHQPLATASRSGRTRTSPSAARPRRRSSSWRIMTRSRACRIGCAFASRWNGARPRRRAARRSRCSASISTISRRSTTRSAIRSAMPCLQAVADRIRACVRPTDTVARLGGDEFAIVQVSADQPMGATALARGSSRQLSEPFDVDGHQVVIGASVGIAVAPDDGDDPDCLLKNADMALYRAKEDGRGIYRFFEPDMDAKMQARRTLELDLRKALALGEFELFYQPLVELDTNRGQRVRGAVAMAASRNADWFPRPSSSRWRRTSAHRPDRRLGSEAGLSRGDELAESSSRSPSTCLRFSSRAAPWSSTWSAALGASGLRRQPARARDHRNSPAAGYRGDHRDAATTCETSASASRWTTSAPAIPAWAICRSFPFDKIKIDRSFIRDLSDRAGFDRHRSGRHRPRQQPRHIHDGRRGRDRSAAATAQRGRLHRGPGLSCSASRYRPIRCSSCCSGSILRIKQWPSALSAQTSFQGTSFAP